MYINALALSIRLYQFTYLHGYQFFRRTFAFLRFFYKQVMLLHTHIDYQLFVALHI